MDFSSWMSNEVSHGATPVDVARAALQLPPAYPGGLQELTPLIEQVATKLRVGISQIHVVGSARFGFSFRDGALFNSDFSDLNLAVIHPYLYKRCEAACGQSISGPRFPELELPAPEAAAFRRILRELSRMALDRFAYISIAVFPDLAVLVDTEASRIQAYLGIEETAPQGATSLAISLGRDSFDSAVRSGFPRFLGRVNESPPGKASPYVIDEVGFRGTFDTSPTRRQLLDALDQAFADVSRIVQVAACLIGGSFINLGRADPHDIDIVIFYRAQEKYEYEPGRALQRLSRKFLLRGIDAHFIPCDAEPWLPIKMASFYTSLFQADRDKPGHDRGLVILVPRLIC